MKPPVADAATSSLRAPLPHLVKAPVPDTGVINSPNTISEATSIPFVAPIKLIPRSESKPCVTNSPPPLSRTPLPDFPRSESESTLTSPPVTTIELAASVPNWLFPFPSTSVPAPDFVSTVEPLSAPESVARLPPATSTVVVRFSAISPVKVACPPRIDTVLVPPVPPDVIAFAIVAVRLTVSAVFDAAVPSCTNPAPNAPDIRASTSPAEISSPPVHAEVSRNTSAAVPSFVSVRAPPISETAPSSVSAFVVRVAFPSSVTTSNPNLKEFPAAVVSVCAPICKPASSRSFPVPPVVFNRSTLIVTLLVTRTRLSRANSSSAEELAPSRRRFSVPPPSSSCAEPSGLPVPADCSWRMPLLSVTDCPEVRFPFPLNTALPLEPVIENTLPATVEKTPPLTVSTRVPRDMV